MNRSERQCRQSAWLSLLGAVLVLLSALLFETSTRRSDGLPLEPLLTVDDVARILKVSRRRVYALRDEGTLSAISLGRTLRFSAAEIQRAIEAGRDEAWGSSR